MKSLLFTLLTVLVTSGLLQANDANLFELDEAQLETEFAALNELEAVVLEEQDGVTLEELDARHPELMSSLNLNKEQMTVAFFSADYDVFSDIVWSAFAWGFCCGPLGVLIVLIGNQGPDYIVSSFLGLLVSGLMFSFGYLLTL